MASAKAASKGKAMGWFKKALSKEAAHEWLAQMPNGKFVWQVHLDMFFKTMKKKSPGLETPEFGEGDYAHNEANNEIFRFWLDEVPEELTMGNDLEPAFKKSVRNYTIANYGFDPYEYDVSEEEGVPSVEELESWFA